MTHLKLLILFSSDRLVCNCSQSNSIDFDHAIKLWIIYAISLLTATPSCTIDRSLTVYKADEDGYVRVAANWIYDDSLCPGRPYIWRRHRFRDANIAASQRNDLRCSLVFGLPGPRRHDLARRSFPTSTPSSLLMRLRFELLYWKQSDHTKNICFINLKKNLNRQQINATKNYSLARKK